MVNISNLIGISIGAVLINNFVLESYISLWPFSSGSKKTHYACGMGLAVIVALILASGCTWFVDQFVLTKFNIEYLRIVVFLLIIASVIQLMEIVIQRYSPVLFESLGIFLPLITTNCTVLGIASTISLISPFTEQNLTLGETFLNSGMLGAGFMLALVIMAGIQQRLELSEIPKLLKGLPISFITAGLIALSFLGFSGLNFFGE